MKKIMILLVVMMFSLGGVINYVSQVEAEEVDIDKEYKEIDLGTKFSDSVVYVVIRHKYSGYNKSFDKLDFLGVDVEYIEYITPLIETEEAEEMININHEEYRQILLLHLENAGVDNVLSAIKTLMENELVYTAYPLYDCEAVYFSGTVTPNDTYYSRQTNLDMINIEEAWFLETGDSNVQVGIIDSGVYEHPDLLSNLTTGSDMVDDTTDTYEDDENIYGHGTLVAGIIGAQPNNNMGVAGINWDVSLVPLQVDDSNFVMSTIKAINKAIAYDLDIINISMGTEQCTQDPFYEAISNYTGLVVCAAGNETRNLDVDDNRNPLFPAETILDNVITVASCGLNGELSATSNYGITTVDIAAPGDTYTTRSCYVNSVSLYHQTGPYTSFSTPQVSGVAALLKAYNPNLTAMEIKQAIIDSATPYDTLEGKMVSGGVLNAYAALCAVYEGNEALNYVASVELDGNYQYSEIELKTQFNNGYYQFSDFIMGGIFPDEADYGTVSVDGNTITYNYGPSYEYPWYLGEDLITYKFTSRRKDENHINSLIYESFINSNSIIKDLNGTVVTPNIIITKALVGDINNDGIISNLDYVIITDIINGEVIPTKLEFLAADVNCSGIINNNDKQELLNYINGAIDCFW